MGCRIIEGKNGDACFYNSCTMTAFGPVVDIEELESFEKWIGSDPRLYSSKELWSNFLVFKKSQEIQKKKKISFLSCQKRNITP